MTSWLYGGGGIPFQLKSDSLPHAHAQITKTYYKHQDSRIKKAQELKTKTLANSDIQDLPSRYQVYQGRLLASFQDDAKYEHSIFSLCYLFRNLFSSTTLGDENPIRTLGDYSKPSHEGYRNTIELPVGNNMVPLRSDTIRLVQNGCSFHGLQSEDPNKHLKNFLKLVGSLDLDGENRGRTRMCLFQFSLRDQASNWLEHLPTESITTWEDLITRFLAQFFPPGRTAKLCSDILMFQQHHRESLSKHGLVSRTYYKKSRIMASTFGYKSNFL
ncbi:zinc finger, CCHC-type containing protein [Tanacetum coccineum]